MKLRTHKSTHVPACQFIDYSPNKQLISPRSGDALNDERWGVAGAIPVSSNPDLEVPDLQSLVSLMGLD